MDAHQLKLEQASDTTIDCQIALNHPALVKA
jgi:hypothetical protein